MRLTPDVALVGSGAYGFDLSAPADCHVYLLDGGEELALVDAGAGLAPGDVDLILANIRAAGLDPHRIGRLLLTHYHFDHIGGVADLRDRLGLSVHAAPLTARIVETGDESTIAEVKRIGLIPSDAHLMPCPATGDLIEGATLTVGRLTVRVVETPGHCAGHVSFLVEGGERTLLIVGDLVFHGGKLALQNIPDCSIQDSAASVRKLAALDFDAFLPGHMTISLRNGKRHIEAAAKAFDGLMVPPNL